MKIIKYIAFVAAAFACAYLLLLSAGCKTPSPFLYDPYTNLVSQTVTPVRTNTVTIYTTNSLNVVTTNTVEKTVYLTNTVLEVGYKPSTNAIGVAGSAGAVSGIIAPGTGGLVDGAIVALLTLAGGFWRHRVVVKRLTDDADAQVTEQKTTTENVAKALTYTIENYRDVLLKAPNGEAIDNKLINEAQKHQTALKVGELVAGIVGTYIKNPDIQQASAAVAAEARRLAGTP